MRRISNRLCLCAALTPLIGVFLTDVVAGQQQLQWSFQPGDHLEIVTAQDVAITAEVAKESIRMSHRTVVQIDWKVSSVDPHGHAEIVQKIERLKVQLKSPGMDELVYDTAADKAPTGPVKQVADALRPLLTTRANLKVDARGQVREVQLNSESKKIDTPAGQSFKQFLTGEGGLELSGLSYLVLPERPVTKGDQWSHTSQVQLAIGAFRRETTYRLTGEEIRGDRKLSKVTLSCKLSPKAEAVPALPGEPERKQPVQIENQKNEGVMLFDVTAGHPVEASLQQQMTVVSQAGTREVKQQIASSTKMKIRRLPEGHNRSTD